MNPGLSRCPKCNSEMTKSEAGTGIFCLSCGYSEPYTIPDKTTKPINDTKLNSPIKPNIKIKPRCATCGRELKNMGGIMVCTWCSPPPPGY